MLRARTWRLVELVVVLILGAAAIEVGKNTKRILVGLVLVALVVVLGILIVTLIERRRRELKK